MSFKDHFSAQSDLYARFRPHYPQELYDFILSLVKNRTLAWDVGTGNGQVALALADHFEKVIATDASENQINNAIPHSNIIYKVSTAENSGFPDAVTDLITVAQAVHWFNMEKFFSEVQRVGKPGSAIVVWGYRIHSISQEVDPVTAYFNSELVGPFWPKEREYIDESYNNIPFPFETVAAPALFFRWRWNLNEMLGYLNTWSSTQRYIRDKGHNPVDIIEKDMVKAWGDPDDEKDVAWPIFIKAGIIK